MKLSEQYKKLYHYTTLRGALSIVQSQTLWATHCRFLNDTTERTLALDKLYEHLLPSILTVFQDLEKSDARARSFFEEKGGIEAVAQHECRVIIDAQSHAAGYECYVTSLCGETDDQYTIKNGLLSQWRGYGKDGGAALVLDTKKVEEKLELEFQNFEYSHLSIADLIYSDNKEKLEEEAQEAMETIRNYSLDILKNYTNGTKGTTSVAEAYSSLVNFMSRYKHRGFKEENEVRIIAWPIYKDEAYRKAEEKSDTPIVPEKKRELRDGHGGLIPYIKLFEGIKDLPVERIIIGPHKDKEKRKEALEIALRGYDIEIDISEIPYVG